MPRTVEELCFQAKRPYDDDPDAYSGGNRRFEATLLEYLLLGMPKELAIRVADHQAHLEVDPDVIEGFGLDPEIAG